MRILQVTDFYPPVVGGLERHVQTLSRALTRRGHEVAVATLKIPGTREIERDGEVEVRRLSGWNRALTRLYQSRGRPFHPTAPDPGVVRGLRGLIAEHRPDVIHARGWMTYSSLAVRRRQATPVVVTLHDYSLVCPKKTLLRHGAPCDGPHYGKCIRCASDQYGAPKSVAITTGRELSRGLHASADRYIAISNSVRAASLRDAFGTPVEVIPSFIPDDSEALAARGPRPDFAPRGDYLMFVGSGSEHKGLPVLLDARRRLDPRPELLVIAPRDAEIPDGLDDAVTVARDVPHAEVMAAWAHCAVGIVPSVWREPFGQVAVEAMAAGRPVVVSGDGGLADTVIDGESGVHARPGDPAALAAATGRLLGDPGLRERMGGAARLRARQFTVSAVVERIEEVYDQLRTEVPA